MEDLGTALRDAARTAAPVHATDPAELWQHGRQRVRRRRLAGAGGLVAAALLAAVALGAGPLSLPDREAGQIAPVPGQAMRLPDEFFEPSGWLPGTEDEGPLGPLVAVIVAERRSLMASGYGLVGVSAATGVYRFLDLPGIKPVRAEEVALSDDGRYLAWWIAVDDAVGPVESSSSRAVGVYDSVTGQVVEHEPPLLPGRHMQGTALVWAGHRLWFDYRSLEDSGDGGSGPGPYCWEPVTGRKPLRCFPPGPLDSVTSDGAALIFQGEGIGLKWQDKDDHDRMRLSGMPNLSLGPVFPGPGGRLAGLVKRASGPEQPLAVSTDEEPLAFSPVPGATAWRVLGWRDDRRVVVHRLAHEPKGFVSVDVRDGSMKVLSVPAPSTWAPDATIIAADAWQAPVYDAPEPERPLDRRVLLGVGALALLGAAFAGLRWRRRVRS